MPGRLVTLKYRFLNAAADLRDRWLRGRCCAAPRYQVDGGYHFWRCGLRRGHGGQHRTVNYLWGHGEGSIYDPVDDAPPRLDRHPVRTGRQSREFERWHRRKEAERRARLA